MVENAARAHIETVRGPVDASALGVALPQSILLRAVEVME